MRKLISILMALVVLLSLGTTALAKTAGDSAALGTPTIDLDVIKSDLTYYVIEAGKYEKIEIGNHMLAYLWDGAELVSSEKEVLFYPIYGDNEIVAILTMFSPHKDQSYTVSIDFARELNSATASGSQPYFIVEAGPKRYIYTNGQATVLTEYGEPMDVNEKELPPHPPAPSTEGGAQPDGQPVVTEGLDISYEIRSSLTLSGLKAYISTNLEKYASILNEAASLDENRIDITPANEPRTKQIRRLDA